MNICLNYSLILRPKKTPLDVPFKITIRRKALLEQKTYISKILSILYLVVNLQY